MVQFKPECHTPCISTGYFFVHCLPALNATSLVLYLPQVTLFFHSIPERLLLSVLWPPCTPRFARDPLASTASEELAEPAACNCGQTYCCERPVGRWWKVGAWIVVLRRNQSRLQVKVFHPKAKLWPAKGSPPAQFPQVINFIGQVMQVWVQDWQQLGEVVLQKHLQWGPLFLQLGWGWLGLMGVVLNEAPLARVHGKIGMLVLQCTFLQLFNE